MVITGGIVQWFNERRESRNMGLILVCRDSVKSRFLESRQARFAPAYPFRQWVAHWTYRAAKVEPRLIKEKFTESGKDSCRILWYEIHTSNKSFDQVFEYEWSQYVHVPPRKTKPKSPAKGGK